MQARWAWAQIYTCPALWPLSPQGNHRFASVSFCESYYGELGLTPLTRPLLSSYNSEAHEGFLLALAGFRQNLILSCFHWLRYFTIRIMYGGREWFFFLP